MSNATIAHEERESLSVGIAHGDVRYAPQIADVVNRWSWDAQEEYGKDSVLTVNGQPIDVLVGAAAVRNAFIRKFGHEPKGIEYRGQLPVTKPFTMQQFKYQMLDGTRVNELDLENPVKWTVEKISEYLEVFHPEVEQPKHITRAHRQALLEALKDTLTPVGAPTHRVSVPWGAVEYPPNAAMHIGPEEIVMICTEADGDQYGHPRNVARFIIIAKKQFSEEVDEFYDLVLEEVPKVYANRFLVMGKNGRVSFLDPWAKVNADEVVLNAEMKAELDIRVRGPINNIHQARLIDSKMLNLKHLFVGEPGTGKTITTLMLAQEALVSGWTVLQCQPGNESEYEEMIAFASMHEPAVVIMEDLEKMMPDQEGLTTQQRLQARSKLLDLFDGGESKGREITFFFTTNYKNLWMSAMARPGRTDSFFEFKPLDREGFERLMRIKLDGMIGEIDWDALWHVVQGMQSSFLASIADYARACVLGKPFNYKLGTTDLMPIIKGLSNQHVWYEDLVTIEESAKALTVGEFYDSMVRPVVEDVMVDAGFPVNK